MSWAARRRFIILLIVGSIVVAFLVILFFATLYKAPSCADGIQNQDETGIDCGGSCKYLCTEQQQPPTVLFTKLLQDGNGRIDVIAKVENKNASAAAKNVPYDITLYGDNQALIQKMSGTIDLPPGASVPVFVPGISSSGKRTGIRAFLEIDPSLPRWFYMSSDARIMPTVSNIKHGGTSSAPRIESVLTNTDVVPLTNVKVIILVNNDDGEVIAASSTMVPTIPAQGQANAIFVWNEAFQNTPTSVEIVPIVPLP